MKYPYRLGNVSFATKEAKEKWILEGILLNLEYIGKETKLSFSENESRKLAIRRIKAVIKTKQG